MRATAAPATNWRENVAPDEATRYKDYAQLLAGLQSAATRKLGRAGRALHRKGHVGAAASFEVLGNLPEPYAAGFFARPGSYGAYVRFSNGSHMEGSDRGADVRGLVVKVFGVPARSCAGRS
jgi:catalase